jgi:hypothetical protein
MKSNQQVVPIEHYRRPESLPQRDAGVFCTCFVRGGRMVTSVYEQEVE